MREVPKLRLIMLICSSNFMAIVDVPLSDHHERRFPKEACRLPSLVSRRTPAELLSHSSGRLTTAMI